MADLILGVDAGATRSRAVLVDLNDQARPAFAERAGANVDHMSDAGLAERFADLRDAVLSQASLGDAQIRLAVLGLAGVTTDVDRSRVVAAAHQAHLAERVIVHNDGEIAVAGAHPTGPGLVLIAGTGSACYGRDALGRTFRVGGWGHQIGDEGSATWIGTEGLRAAVRAVDGRGHDTQLVGAMFDHFAIDEPDAIHHALYVERESRAAAAAFAPRVVACAEVGDAVARAVLDDAAGALAELVVAATRTKPLPNPVPVSVTGGVLDSVHTLQGAIDARLQAQGIGVQWTPPAFPPTLGAILVALHDDGRAQRDAVDLITPIRDALDARARFPRKESSA